MKLIGVHLSPFVRKVAIVLNAKGLDYEQEVVVPGMFPPEFKKISPLNKIPVLEDGELTLPDSSVICEYLEEKYPEPSLLPEGLEQRAEARFIEELGDSRLMEVAAIPFRENFINPRMRDQEPDVERVREAEEQLIPEILDYIETRIPQDGFLFGSLCTADAALLSPMMNASIGGYKPDPNRWPKFVAYLDRLKAHPPVAKTLELEAEAMKSLLG